MNQELQQAQQTFIQGMIRISHFWGFPKAMGAIYGAIYLAPAPLSLDEIVEQVGVTKGAVSTNVRTLERLGMVHKQLQLGDRKDYYTPETDFWKIIRTVLREREKQEFDVALRTVDDSLAIVNSQAATASDPEDAEMTKLYRERMEKMKSFFHTLDNIVATLLALDELRLSTVQRLFGKTTTNKES